MHEAYLAQLPADLRTRPARESTWWRWRDMDVHVERVGDPDAPSKVILLHGAGGHAGAVWPYAALAAGQGCQVIVPDLPGYGRTRVPCRHAVRYADWVGLVCDLVVVEMPSLLIGASMGGLLAYDVATRTGVVERILVTCLLDPRDAVARRHISRYPWLGATSRPVLRALAGPLAGVSVPVRWLTNMRAIANKPELVDIVVRDRWGGGGRVPLGFIRSFLDSAPAVEPEDAAGTAVVLAHPDDDRWTPTSVSLRFFERLAGPKELVILEGAGHYPVETPGAHQLAEAIRACTTRHPTTPTD